MPLSSSPCGSSALPFHYRSVYTLSYRWPGTIVCVSHVAYARISVLCNVKKYYEKNKFAVKSERLNSTKRNGILYCGTSQNHVNMPEESLRERYRMLRLPNIFTTLSLNRLFLRTGVRFRRTPGVAFRYTPYFCKRSLKEPPVHDHLHSCTSYSVMLADGGGFGGAVHLWTTLRNLYLPLSSFLPWEM